MTENASGEFHEPESVADTVALAGDGGFDAVRAQLLRFRIEQPAMHQSLNVDDEVVGCGRLRFLVAHSTSRIIS